MSEKTIEAMWDDAIKEAEEIARAAHSNAIDTEIGAWAAAEAAWSAKEAFEAASARAGPAWERAENASKRVDELVAYVQKGRETT